jgi:hypothetical protein
MASAAAALFTQVICCYLAIYVCMIYIYDMYIDI